MDIFNLSEIVLKLGSFFTDNILWISFFAYLIIVIFITGALFYHWFTYKIPGHTPINLVSIVYLIGIVFFTILPFSILIAF